MRATFWKKCAACSMAVSVDPGHQPNSRVALSCSVCGNNSNNLRFIVDSMSSRRSTQAATSPGAQNRYARGRECRSSAAGPAKWRRAGGHNTFDPAVALAFFAAATTTVRLMTHLWVLPFRNPYLTAKTLTSLDEVSGGRLIAGVGAVYLRSEFAAHGSGGARWSTPAP